jgi:hypothetical protein
MLDARPIDNRPIETFNELVGRGLSTLEALGVWLHDREGRAELRPTVGGLVLCTIHTRWHVLSVPGNSFEAGIAAACRRVDEYLQDRFAHLQTTDTERPEPL